MLVYLIPAKDGFFTSEVWELSGNRMPRARMQVNGNLMRPENCAENQCRGEVSRRVRQGFQRRKFVIIVRPVVWLFSG